MGRTTANPDTPNYVSEDVRDFILSMHDSLKESNPSEVGTLWATRRSEITKNEFSVNYKDRRRKERQWPKWEAILAAVPFQPTELLKQIYNFHCCQHRISGGTHSVEVLQSSLEAIDKLLTHLFRDTNTNLPSNLIWNIFSELLYQLHVALTRVRPSNIPRDPQEMQWSVSQCFRWLQAFEQIPLSIEKGFQLPAENRLRAAIFARITLVRLSVMLGDYRGALQRCEPLYTLTHLRGALSGSPAIHVALYYHIAFAYMMQRRFHDASRMLRISLSISVDDSETYTHRLVKEIPQLIAVNCHLSGSKMDLRGMLHSKDLDAYEDIYDTLNSVETIVDVFCTMGMPYFLDAHHTKDSLQARMFRRMAQQLQPVIHIRTHAANHSNLSLSRVAHLNNVTESDALGGVMVAKGTVKQLIHDGRDNNLLSGSEEQSCNINFRIDGKTISIISISNTASPEAHLISRVRILRR